MAKARCSMLELDADVAAAGLALAPAAPEDEEAEEEERERGAMLTGGLLLLPLRLEEDVCELVLVLCVVWWPLERRAATSSV